MGLVWPCASEALSLLRESLFAFQYNPIGGDIHSERERREQTQHSLYK